MEPGRYRSPDWFPVHFELDVGDSWRAFTDPQLSVVSLVRGENSVGHADQYLTFIDHPREPESLISKLERTPLMLPGDAGEIEIDGVGGVTLDAVAEPNPQQEGSEEIAPGSIELPAVVEATGFWYTESSGAALRFIALKPDGTTLLIYIEAPSEIYPSFLRDAERVIDTLVFGFASTSPSP